MLQGNIKRYYSAYKPNSICSRIILHHYFLKIVAMDVKKHKCFMTMSSGKYFIKEGSIRKYFNWFTEKQWVFERKGQFT